MFTVRDKTPRQLAPVAGLREAEAGAVLRTVAAELAVDAWAACTDAVNEDLT